MCGIAGIITKEEGLLREALGRMLDRQHHRGPDDRGMEIFRFGDLFLGLGHTRLSILDLSAAGHQPMIHKPSGSAIVYNGEIYNFMSLRKQLEAKACRFYGHSDTEVLLGGLAAEGAAFLRQLQGMYAFAYVDVNQRRLLLARDPLGIKPLYTASSPTCFIFASEVQAILESGLVSRTLEAAALPGLMAYGAVQEPFTIFRNIRAFPSGQWQEIDLSQGQEIRIRPVQKFWDFPPVRRQITEEEAIQTVPHLLRESVRDHLVSDVPVGIFLSSGLDSTILCGLAAECQDKIKTFTIGIQNDPVQDEGILASRTAALFGTEHTGIELSDEEAQQFTQDWFLSLDQPSVDGLNTYIISRAIRRNNIIVALSGLGGDELFGGYRSFADVPRLYRWMNYFSWMPASFRRMAGRMISLGKPQVFSEKTEDAFARGSDLPSLYLSFRRNLSDKKLSDLGLRTEGLGLTDNFISHEMEAELNWSPEDVVALVARFESKMYMKNMLLRDSDTNGMACSLEIRVPFLDQRILEYAYSLPSRVRLPGGIANKHLLRKGFSAYLRPELTQLKKRGFTLPISAWLRGPLKGLCQDGLGYLETMGLFNNQKIDQWWTAFQQDPQTIGWSRIFLLGVIGIYCQKNKL
jgi:asparagine synthase (glutamine-hydrolysing)